MFSGNIHGIPVEMTSFFVKKNSLWEIILFFMNLPNSGKKGKRENTYGHFKEEYSETEGTTGIIIPERCS